MACSCVHRDCVIVNLPVLFLELKLNEADEERDKNTESVFQESTRGALRVWIETCPLHAPLSGLQRPSDPSSFCQLKEMKHWRARRLADDSFSDAWYYDGIRNLVSCNLQRFCSLTLCWRKIKYFLVTLQPFHYNFPCLCSRTGTRSLWVHLAGGRATKASHRG